MTTIRSATPGDAARIREIYAYYVEHTAITFEWEAPSVEELRDRMCRTLERYPYLVAEQDGVVMGYAYAGPLSERAAYGWSCELSVYVDRAARRTGLGRALYDELEARLAALGMRNLYACIAYPCEGEGDEYLGKNSAQFHEHLGFVQVGRFHRCGHKFGRWYDVVWMEKLIGSQK